MTRRTAASWLSPDEIRDFTRASNARGALSILTTWALIAAAFALLAAFPRNPLAWLTTLILLGGRQLGLAILMHECAHHSLFETVVLNERLGSWLCAAPMWQRLHDYRTHHIKHHVRTSLDDDPDLGLSSAFPTSRASLARKFLRDLSGLAFARRVAALLLMDAGALSYTASTGARFVVPRPSTRVLIGNLLKNTTPMLLTNGLLFVVLAVTGNAWLFAVWVLAYATTFSLFLRIRSIAEHAVTQQTADPLLNTRTTRANWLARLTVAPHHVNLHLEHHLLPRVPHYKLPALQRLLENRGVYAEATHEPGYFAVLRKATSRTAG